MSMPGQQRNSLRRSTPYGRDDALRDYLKSLQRFPLLSPEEELRAARKVEAAKRRVAYTVFQSDAAREMLTAWLHHRTVAPRKRRHHASQARTNEASESGASDVEQLAKCHEQIVREAAVASSVGPRSKLRDEAVQKIARMRRRAAHLAARMNIDPAFLSRVTFLVLRRDSGQHEGIETENHPNCTSEPLCDSRDAPTLRAAAHRDFDALVTTLRRQVAQYEDAKRTFCEHNLRLVVSVAKRYRHIGLPFLDLIQEGNIGLLLAAERFDYRRGCRFSTYAVWWIRRYVAQAVAVQGRVIRVSERMVRRISQIEQLTRQLLHDSGREPGIEQLGEALGICEKEVFQILPILRRPTSLESAEYAGSIDLPERDPGAPGTLELNNDELELLQRRLAAALSVLSYCEREIIKLRYAVGDDSTHTLDEVGAIFGLSGERVRQIERRALQKLRATTACENLLDFLIE